jgi:hypothetical protein
MLAGLRWSWIGLGFGPGKSATGFQMVSCWIPIVLMAGVVICSAICWNFTGKDELVKVVALAAGFAFAFTLVTLLVAESSSDVLPDELVPATFRRSTGVVVAGPGLWTTLTGAALVLVVAVSAAVSRFNPWAWRWRNGRREALATVALLTLAILVAWLRYQPWVGSKVLGHTIEISGQAAPLIGPASLLALAPLAAALVLSACSQFTAAGLVAAFGGWMITFCAAIALIVTQTIPGLHLDDLVRAGGGSGDVTVHTTAAAWGTYVSGIAIAAVGAFLVCSAHRWEAAE